MTRIVATIGPACESQETLQFFKEHSVEIARLNFSHNQPEWHIETGLRCRQAGLVLMVDLAGPKVLLGSLSVDKCTVASQEMILIEKQQSAVTYPYRENGLQVLPCQFEIHKFSEPDQPILIDDGKIQGKILQVLDHGRVCCLITHGGVVKSNKGVNMPLSDLNLDFLVERDREFLAQVVPAIRPEYVAPSFVKTLGDLEVLKDFLKTILNEHGIGDYYPKICTKIEMGEAVRDHNLSMLVEHSDMIMIARGDLALETLPNHIRVPFYQEKIKRLCRATGTPFIVATQILETMSDNPVPTRAEVSDLYRAVVLDQADYIMLSGESASGQFPTRCVSLMHEMITQSDAISRDILGDQ